MTRKIDRRQALAAMGTVSLGGLLAACGDEDAPTAPTASTAKTTTSKATADAFDGAATCQVSTELTEGPYYFDVDSIRSDIREDREGTLLRLAIRVREAGSCEPIENAVVDIWHCDATGNYSGFEAASQGGPGGPGGAPARPTTRPISVGRRSRTRTASSSSRRSTRAGTGGARRTSTRRFTSTGRRSSRRSSSRTARSTRRSTRASPTARTAGATPSTTATASTSGAAR